MTMVRRAVQGDALTLAELARGAYARYADRVGREPVPMTADYPALIRAGEVWVAEYGDVVAGLLVIKAKPDHVLLDLPLMASETLAGSTKGGMPPLPTGFTPLPFAAVIGRVAAVALVLTVVAARTTMDRDVT